MQLGTEDFKFHIPVELVEKGKGLDKKLMLKGIASTDDYDRQGEIMKNKGFDLSFFKDHGHLNFHHKNDAASIIGFPTIAKLTDSNQLYTEFELYDKKESRAAYDLTKAMNKTGKRKMGFSIEGKVLERDPINKSIVTKARITGCALTHLPVNASTYADVVKSMEGVDEVASEDEVIKKSISQNGGETVMLEGMTTTGAPLKVMMNGDVIISTLKGLDTDSARAVIPESVEGGTKPKNKKQPADANGGCGCESISKSEIYEKMFEQNPDLSPQDAIRTMDVLMKNLQEQSKAL